MIAGEQTEHSTELKEFMLVLRRALIMIVAYIEKKYKLD